MYQLNSKVKLPSFQFYVGDWRKDPGVQSLPFHDRGVWFEILCLMHESEQRGRLLLNGEPMPNEALARLLGLSMQDLSKTLTTLLNFGVASIDEDGVLFSRRMVRDERLRQIRKEAGEKGGNPDLVKQKASKSEKEVNRKPKQIITPSSSSSFSSSASSLEEERTEETPRAASPKARPLRGTRIPEPFMLTAAMREWAVEKQLSVDLMLETEKFVNHWKAKTGKDATKLDWPAIWRNWILNARGTYNNGIQQKTTSEREKSAQRIENGDRMADQLRQRAAELERSQNPQLPGDDDQGA